MKKIVFIINNFLLGGTEKFLFDLIKRIDKKRFCVSIVTTLGGGILENQYKTLCCKIYFSGPKRYPVSNLSELLWLPVVFLRLTVFLIKTKPDIVVTSLYQSDILGIFSARLTGVKKRIFIQHDVYPLNLFFKWLKEKLAVNLSTQIIANSFSSRNFLIDYFKTPDSKITVIKNGADINELKQGIKQNYNPSDPVLGIIGRLEPIKGHIYLLEALKILKERYNLKPKILIVGDGALRRKLERFVQENNLDNIKFLGIMPQATEALKLIDVLIVPSLSEGFGLVALEGLLSHKVVIASDLPVIRELIREKESGLLFKPGASLQLADIIYRLLSQPGLYERLRAQTEEWARSRGNDFDIANIAFQYEKVFR